MRMSSLVGRQIKEVPKDASTISHVYLLRGGYIRPVSTGIYSLLPMGRRITAKIEAIIREEMNAIEGQEVLLPVVLPRELWEESGRYQGVGEELLRFQDRNGKDMLLGMTHEEAVVALARTEVTSYKQLPCMMYQLQTKYRDEARPRAGLIRVREFTMKDGYSFHADQADLDVYYNRCHDAYERIFRRLGMTNVLSIESDTGMMGGSKAHEFMAVADCGEDTIFFSPDKSYRANKEIAVTGLSFERSEPQPLQVVDTPGFKTIEEVSGFLGVTPDQTGKAVFFVDGDDRLIFAMLRGDLEVNEAKLRKAAQAPRLYPAPDASIRKAGAVPGYAGPVGLDLESIVFVMDPSVAQSNNLVVGANAEDKHMTGFDPQRDLGISLDNVVIADIATAREGDPCPRTGEPLQSTRGIEVGNIFQLGTKYSAAMNGTFLDEQGKAKPYIMGCYGIGVGRAMASVLEQRHDDYGPIWPLSIAPFELHLLALNYNKDVVKEPAEQLYAALRGAGVDVVFDDRNKKAGFAFADADLLGVPFRIVISPKTLRDGQVELRSRDKAIDERVAIEDAVARVRALLTEARSASL
ncbi:MAG: proline--tRNA ligase [Myxococcota bacterium]